MFNGKTSSRERLRQQLLIWSPIIAGLIVLYLPSLVDLFRGIWSTDQQAHGPIVLGIACWLIYRKWAEMWRLSEGQTPSAVSRLVRLHFRIGVVRYWPLTRHLIFEIGSIIWLLAAILLLVRGSAALKAQWFPLFFMLFMVPLPSAVVDALTMPMKMAVSYVAENILFWGNYPIARTGVILQIGQYKLLVADACAGLHTLFTLEALGLLYLNVIRHDSLFRNIALAILIVPISFTANVIRVMILTLITYHFGDEAGQGFLHGFAGMVLFLSALLLIIGVDTLLQLTVKLRRGNTLRGT